MTLRCYKKERYPMELNFYIISSIVFGIIFYLAAAGIRRRMKNVQTALFELKSILQVAHPIFTNHLVVVMSSGISNKNLLNEITHIEETASQDFFNIKDDEKFKIISLQIAKYAAIEISKEDFETQEAFKSFCAIDKPARENLSHLIKRIVNYNNHVARLEQICSVFPLNLIAKIMKVRKLIKYYE